MVLWRRARLAYSRRAPLVDAHLAEARPEVVVPGAKAELYPGAAFDLSFQHAKHRVGPVVKGPISWAVENQSLMVFATEEPSPLRQEIYYGLLSRVQDRGRLVIGRIPMFALWMGDPNFPGVRIQVLYPGKPSLLPAEAALGKEAHQEAATVPGHQVSEPKLVMWSLPSAARLSRSSSVSVRRVFSSLRTLRNGISYVPSGR